MRARRAPGLLSPEQVAGDQSRLDRRSDVYALGVLTYELLTERLPHDLTGRAVPDAARVIRDERPPRLSSIRSAYRGDLETIVDKAQTGADLSSPRRSGDGPVTAPRGAGHRQRNPIDLRSAHGRTVFPENDEEPRSWPRRSAKRWGDLLP